MCSPPQFSSVWPPGQRQDGRHTPQYSPCPQAWGDGKNWRTNSQKLDCQCCAILPLGSPCLLPALVLPLLTTPLHWGLVPYSVTTLEQSTPVHWAELLCPEPHCPKGWEGIGSDKTRHGLHSWPQKPLHGRVGNKTGSLLGCTHLLLLPKPSVLWSSSLALPTKI